MTITTRPIHQAQFGQAIPVSIDDMFYEIKSQSRVIDKVIEKIHPQLEAIDPTLFAQTQHIYLTGCGDSYFAGIAARYAFEKFTHIPTEPLEALEFGRYVSEFVPRNSLVFGISNSGKAVRAVEALINGKLGGAVTLAITGNEKGWLAQEAEHVLNQAIKVDDVSLTMPSNLDNAAPRRGSFGLSNYLASLTTLYVTAIYIGKVNGTLTAAQADVLLGELRQAAEAIEATVERCTPAVQEYAESVRDEYTFGILGGGPNYATALFYSAKTFELARINGVAQQLEEWAHEQFFLTETMNQLIFIDPVGRTNSRALELMRTVKTMGATSVVIADDKNEQARATADVVFPLAGDTPEYFTPIPCCVPGELFATFLAKARGRNAFEFDSNLQYEMNMRTLQESQILEFHKEQP